MMSIRLEPAQTFLENFFRDAPFGQTASQHFRQTVQKVETIAEIRDVIAPEDGCKKVIVLDGHPRAGKTWSTLLSVCRLIDDGAVAPDEIWTSGVDSWNVFGDAEMYLPEACEKVREHLVRDRPRLVLLDDFLGTNQPRLLSRQRVDLVELRRLLRPYFSWNDDNPWISALAPGGVLILTGRSVLFNVMDVLLGVRARAPDPGAREVRQRVLRRGIFENFHDDSPFGTFASQELRSAAEANLTHHPLRHRRESLLRAAPFIVLSERSRFNPTEGDFKTAADSIFGDDIRTLAQLSWQWSTRSDSERDTQGAGSESHALVSEVSHEIDKIYLLSVAPGLLFLGAEAFGALGLEDDSAKQILIDLYFSNSDDTLSTRKEWLDAEGKSLAGFRAGRVPNRLYMYAVGEHLGRSIKTAAAAFGRVIQRRSEEGAPLPGVALGVRGFLERALHDPGRTELGKRRIDIDELVQMPAFSGLLSACMEERNDLLLRLEAKRKVDFNGGQPINPGFIAAAGFVLPDLNDIDHGILREFVEAFVTSFGERAGGGSTGPDGQDWMAIAAYSTLLQTVIRLPSGDDRTDALDSLARLATSGAGGYARELQIVLDDELIWGYEEHDLARLPVTGERLATLQALPDPRTTDPVRRSFAINRLFSLAWHNEWCDADDGDLTALAAQWRDCFLPTAIGWLHEQPELLDDNLQYHWCHFITQRAVWMREWCFNLHPNSAERSYSQIAAGSSDAQHHHAFAEIARALLCAPRQDDARLRNLLLLVGTRLDRLDGCFAIIEAHVTTLCDRPELCEAVLQAVFELGRQGFLEQWSEGPTPVFREWCRARVRSAPDERMISAWKAYREELERVSYSSDLLPSPETGWRDVLPSGWIPL